MAMRNAVIIIAALVGVLAGSLADARETKAYYFCCATVNDDGDRGEDCKRIHEDDVDRCERDNEVLVCDGGWVRSHVDVTCGGA
jgi:hypothetical protein